MELEDVARGLRPVRVAKELTMVRGWLAVQLIHCLDKLGLAQKMMLSALAWLACSGLSLICIPTPAAPAVEAVHSLCQQLVCA